MKIFQTIGEKIDLGINWLFTFKDNDLQLLIWSGFIAALLVFIIEYLRKPRISVSFLDYGFDFKLPNCVCEYEKSKNWKFEVRYKKSFLSKILFRYPLNNLKVKVSIYNDSLQLIKEFQAKPDFNPNVYQERDIPPALAGINLTKGESDRFPFINKSAKGWLVFDVWEIFIRRQDRKFLNDGIYFAQVNIISDQTHKKHWAKFRLNDNQLNLLKLNLIEKLKVTFI